MRLPQLGQDVSMVIWSLAIGNTSLHKGITTLYTKGVSKITQTLSVTVPIPDTHVLIAKDEYDELLNYSLDPVWDLKELKRKLKMSSDDTIKDRLLFNPKFEKLLKQQGIAHYPDESLNRWRFNARKMNKFIDEHFEEIHRKGRWIWTNYNSLKQHS